MHKICRYWLFGPTILNLLLTAGCRSTGGSGGRVTVNVKRGVVPGLLITNFQKWRKFPPAFNRDGAVIHGKFPRNDALLRLARTLIDHPPKRAPRVSGRRLAIVCDISELDGVGSVGQFITAVPERSGQATLLMTLPMHRPGGVAALTIWAFRLTHASGYREAYERLLLYKWDGKHWNRADGMGLVNVRFLGEFGARLLTGAGGHSGGH